MYPRQEYSIGIALFNSRFMRVVLVLIVLALGWKVTVITGEYLVWQRKERAATIEHEKLLARTAKMQREFDMLASPEGRESVVRERFVVERPGEQTVIIVDGSATSSDTEIAPMPWYIRIFSWMHFEK